MRDRVDHITNAEISPGLCSLVGRAGDALAAVNGSSPPARVFIDCGTGQPIGQPSAFHKKLRYLAGMSLERATKPIRALQ